MCNKRHLSLIITWLTSLIFFLSPSHEGRSEGYRHPFGLGTSFPKAEWKNGMKYIWGTFILLIPPLLLIAASSRSTFCLQLRLSTWQRLHFNILKATHLTWGHSKVAGTYPLPPEEVTALHTKDQRHLRSASWAAYIQALTLPKARRDGKVCLVVHISLARLTETLKHCL